MAAWLDRQRDEAACAFQGRLLSTYSVALPRRVQLFNGAFSKLAPFISHAVSLHRAGSISRYAKLGKQTAAPPKISICVPFAEVLPSNLVSPPIIHHSNPQFLLYKHPYYSYFIRYLERFFKNEALTLKTNTGSAVVG
jgi:hypothetical protein